MYGTITSLPRSVSLYKICSSNLGQESDYERNKEDGVLVEMDSRRGRIAYRTVGRTAQGPSTAPGLSCSLLGVWLQEFSFSHLQG